MRHGRHYFLIPPMWLIDRDETGMPTRLLWTGSAVADARETYERFAKACRRQATPPRVQHPTLWKEP